MRLVLVHMLARLPREEIAAISESINRDLAQLDQAGLDAEQAMIPYRAAADDILARALQLSESGEQDDPQTDQ